MPRPKGTPKTGGRVKGVPNRRSLRLQAEVAATGFDPVQYMLAVMRDESASDDRRDRMAAAVAPYVNPRLAVVDARVVATVEVARAAAGD
jgi:hypothetical protein